ncbi:MAG: DNA polymerase I [Fibrobacteres bacterium]|nr:DNA polymerase I [Fibrobacterota bacterium]
MSRFLLFILLMAAFSFTRVIGIDFEFSATDGNRPAPICMVAKDFTTGVVHRIWQDELARLIAPPFPHDDSTCLVAYYASAELGCFRTLDWCLPDNVIDLYAEFRNKTNGNVVPHGNGLLGALEYYGKNGISSGEKKEMRDLILRGGPWTDCEKRQILEYCQSDVSALEILWGVMLPTLNIQQALLRGEFMKCVALMEHNGIPLDTPMLDKIVHHRETIVRDLIKAVDADYGVYQAGKFSSKLFAQYLCQHRIAWPKLPTGHLALDDDTFRDMSAIHPELEALHNLRNTLTQLRKNKLAVGIDGRNRTLLSPFKSITGRCQPSNSRFIFGMTSCYRHLIKPKPGTGIGCADYEQQEFLIAAVLSGDEPMRIAYESGDPYISFAQMAGGVPKGATKATHPEERSTYKTCALAVQFGQGEFGLAERTGLPMYEAVALLNKHRSTFKEFWRWSDAVEQRAALTGLLSTDFGWQCRWGAGFNPRSARNFPVQATGAEMLRLACIYAFEAGVKVLAPIHDAICFEYRIDEKEATIAKVKDAMSRASKAVLKGHEVCVDVKTVDYPNNFVPERGHEIWKLICESITQIENKSGMQT